MHRIKKQEGTEGKVKGECHQMGEYGKTLFGILLALLYFPVHLQLFE